MPDLPTMMEAGVPGYDIATWFGIAAPANTPRTIVARLNAETHTILQLPVLAQQFAHAGIELMPSTAEEMGDRIRREIPVRTKIMREAGIEAQ
jgi:tripartite-type tricarboxylate transporter receptor subunit TctC